jgi:hypothetical protein
MRDEAACEHGSRAPKLPALLAASVLVLSPATVLAQYVVGPSFMVGGGARLSGGSYVATGTTGQSSFIFTCSGGSTITHHGFWHAGGGLNPMVLSIALLSGTTARLSLNAVPGASHYDLYRSSTAHFGALGAPWQTVANVRAAQ